VEKRLINQATTAASLLSWIDYPGDYYGYFIELILQNYVLVPCAINPLLVASPLTPPSPLEGRGLRREFSRTVRVRGRTGGAISACGT
jgi:hypothetical protein